jgi:hypothetical protein
MRPVYGRCGECGRHLWRVVCTLVCVDWVCAAGTLLKKPKGAQHVHRKGGVLLLCVVQCERVCGVGMGYGCVCHGKRHVCEQQEPPSAVCPA